MDTDGLLRVCILSLYLLCYVYFVLSLFYPVLYVPLFTEVDYHRNSSIKSRILRGVILQGRALLVYKQVSHHVEFEKHWEKIPFMRFFMISLRRMQQNSILFPSCAWLMSESRNNE